MVLFLENFVGVFPNTSKQFDISQTKTKVETNEISIFC